MTAHLEFTTFLGRGRLTRSLKTETVSTRLGDLVGSMMRMTTAIAGAALAGALLVSIPVRAEPVFPAAQTRNGSSTDFSAQRRLKRIPIYPRQEEHWQPDVVPRYNPGPNAVRVCNATYVQEARPSGTVIVPRMSCYWRRG
jgi:hypothetical protein